MRTDARMYVTAADLAELTGINFERAAAFHETFFHVIESSLRNNFTVVLVHLVLGGTTDLRETLDEFDFDSAGPYELDGRDLTARMKLSPDDSDALLTELDVYEIVNAFLGLGTVDFGESDIGALFDAAVQLLERAPDGEVGPL